MANKKQHPPGMRGWIDIGSDVSWDDYGGKWAKKGPDGAWYIVRFENMYEACGEDDCKRDGQEQYVCEVLRVDLRELDEEQLASALQCHGYKLDGETVVNEYDGAEVCGPAHRELCLVECCVGYGIYAPLDSYSGDVRPSHVRAEARRAAEALMRDAERLEERLDRPVNKIGSTAREFGKGDLDSALSRGPFDASKQLVRKMHGLAPDPVHDPRNLLPLAAIAVAVAVHSNDAPKTTFGVLAPDGTYTETRRLSQVAMQLCPFAIMAPEHYREDATCKCNDPMERARMIAEWEYTEEDFKQVGLA